MKRILISFLLYNIFLILTLHYFVDLTYYSSAIVGFTTSLIMLCFKIKYNNKVRKK